MSCWIGGIGTFRVILFFRVSDVVVRQPRIPKLWHVNVQLQTGCICQSLHQGHNIAQEKYWTTSRSTPQNLQTESGPWQFDVKGGVHSSMPSFLLGCYMAKTPKSNGTADAIWYPLSWMRPGCYLINKTSYTVQAPSRYTPRSWKRTFTVLWLTVATGFGAVYIHIFLRLSWEVSIILSNIWTL